MNRLLRPGSAAERGIRETSAAAQPNPRKGSVRLSSVGLKVMWKKQRTSTFSHHRRVKRLS